MPQSSSNRDAPASGQTKQGTGLILRSSVLCTMAPGLQGQSRNLSASSWAENIKRLARKAGSWSFAPLELGQQIPTSPTHSIKVAFSTLPRGKIHIDWAACPYPHFVFKLARKLDIFPAGNAVFPFCPCRMVSFVEQGQPHRWIFPNHRENGASEWAETPARASTFPAISISSLSGKTPR